MSVSEGREGRDAALDLLEQHRAEYIEQCRSTGFHLASFTVDDIRKLNPVPEEFDARVLGSVMATRAFVRVDYASTSTKTSHARPIGVFKLRSWVDG